MTHPSLSDQTPFTIAHAAQKRAIHARQRKQSRLALKSKKHDLASLAGLPKRSPSQQIGDRYEALAWEALSQAGCSLLGKQLRCPVGELDLVVRDGQTLVFVEVRYRASQRFGGAAASITRAKQARLMKAIDWWLPKMVKAAFAGKMPRCRIDLATFEQDTLTWHKDAVRLDQDK
jgi:putative endonuclease